MISMQTLARALVLTPLLKKIAQPTNQLSFEELALASASSLLKLVKELHQTSNLPLAAASAIQEEVPLALSHTLLSTWIPANASAPLLQLMQDSSALHSRFGTKKSVFAVARTLLPAQLATDSIHCSAAA